MLRIALITLMLNFPALALSVEIQSPEEIRQWVGSYTLEASQKFSPANSQVEVNVGKLSPFLNLSKCKNNPELFVHNGKLTQRNVTVGVRCAEEHPWTVYLPVSIQRHAKVYVASRAIRRGQTIQASDIHQETFDLARLHHGYITDPKKIIGNMSARNLSQGSAIRPDAMERPRTVNKGEKVIISANLSGILIKMGGQALENGVTGELISVKNLSSNKVVEAEIIRPGVVEVRM